MKSEKGADGENPKKKTDEQELLLPAESPTRAKEQAREKVDTGIPEAMPLIRKISLLNCKDDNMLKKTRKPTNPHYSANLNKEPVCMHDEDIQDWKCQTCNANISKFDIFFDDNEGKVQTFTQIEYENTFLQDFKDDFKQQAHSMMRAGKVPSPIILYTAYQPNNIMELKEFMFMIISKQIKKINQNMGEGASPFGTGKYQNLSGKLLKYLIQHNDRCKRLRENYGNSILLFDSLFESGNLLQAQKSVTKEDTYNLFMQVDTNTRGHQ